MAKIVVEFDSVTKALSVSLDGQAVTDVDGIYFGPRWCYDPTTYRESKVMGVEISCCQQLAAGVEQRMYIKASVRPDGALELAGSEKAIVTGKGLAGAYERIADILAGK